MSWQDELRRLDEELAAGRISADDYRLRRDQILSTAVSPGSEPAPNANESTTMMQPVQNQPPEGGNGGDADKTQIVSGQDVGDSDRTQAVGGWRATPPDDPNRTQVVPGVPPQSHMGAQPPRPAPPAQHSPPSGFPEPPWQNEEDLSPPWAGQEFPPLAAAGTPDWARQGPEVFETEKKSSAGKVFGIIAVVVVLLGIAAGAYFMFRPDGNEQADPTEEKPPPTQTAPPTEEEPEGPIPELPGAQQNMSKIENFADVEAIDHLTPQEIALYKQGGADASAMAISVDDGVRIIVVVVTMSDDTAAAAARDALASLQLRFSLSEIEAPEGVLAAQNPKATSGPLTRAHYSSGDSVVRIQTQGKDGEAAASLFDEVLDAQLEQLPADG